ERALPHPQAAERPPPHPRPTLVVGRRSRRPRLRDTGRVMSQENLEAFRRSIEAANRRDLDGLLEELDPAVEWHAGLFELLGGEATVYRGREGARQAVRELLEAFPDFQLDISEARALGDR